MSNVFCDKCKHYYSISGYYDHEPHCEPKTTGNIRAKFEKWVNANDKNPERINGAYCFVEKEWQGYLAATASMQAENQKMREALEIIAKDNYFNDLSKLAANTVRQALNDTKQTTEGE